jgi:hypothetical protein
MEADQHHGGAGEAVPAVGPLLERVAGFYHKALLRGSRGLRYLAKRGLEDSRLLESFSIGHCDGSLMNVLAESDPKRCDFLRLGLAAEKEGRLTERFLEFPRGQASPKWFLAERVCSYLPAFPLTTGGLWSMILATIEEG